VVVQRATLAQRDAHHLLLGVVGRLADRLRHLAGLAVAEADTAALVADDDEGSKAEATTALDHLGHAVDADQLVDELAVLAIAIPTAAIFSLASSHNSYLPIRTTGRLRGR